MPASHLYGATSRTAEPTGAVAGKAMLLQYLFAGRDLVHQQIAAII
jgi:hypothetical protein